MHFRKITKIAVWITKGKRQEAKRTVRRRFSHPRREESSTLKQAANAIDRRGQKKKKKGIVRKGESKCSCDTKIFFLFYKIHIPKLLAFLPKITPEELRLWNLIEFKF